MASSCRLQSGLGEVSSNKTVKDRNWNSERIRLAKVLKVHHKRNTVDVQLLDNGESSADTVRSKTENEGMYSCRVCVPYAGTNMAYNKPYGKTVAIQKDNIVVVAFMKGDGNRPIVIGMLHSCSEDVGEVGYDNILPEEYPLTDLKEMYRSSTVTRTQDFYTMDGDGEIEAALHSKTFLIGTSQEFDPNTFDYEDLSVKDKETGETISLYEDDSPPLKYLLCFRDNYDDEKTNYLRLFVDAAKVAFNLFRQTISNPSLSMFALDEDGTVRMRRQPDSSTLDEGGYSEVTIKPNGDILLEQGSGSSSISLTSGRITLSAADITVEGNLNITGNVSCAGSCNHQCRC